ncbi:SET domain-containing protein [Xylariaceae sp. FL0594]|nr:SET domain-containing protein [Xylariaceae sp. FL0594]
MSDPVFEERSLRFLEWFKAWPGASFHENIEIQDLRNQNRGRGIIAKSDIPEDTVLFTIPRAAIINTETSDLARRIPDVFATTVLDDADNEADEDGIEASGPPDNWVSLILVMMYEYLQSENSRWKRYFDVLPTEFDTLMWWSGKELDALQASSIIGKIGKDDADSMFRTRVLPIVEKNPDVFYPPGSHKLSDDELMLLAHRIGSTIMAYAFDLENDDEDANEEQEDEWVEDKEGRILMGMVPMADILNADAEFNAHVNHEKDCLTVTAIKPIAAGEEVLNYYGPLGNGELLRRYGYVSAHHARYDVVELSWELVLSALKATLAVDETVWGKAAAELDPEEVEDAFVLDRDLEEPDSRGELHGDMTLKRLPEDLREQINAILKEVRKISPESIPDKQRRDEICFSAMRRAFQLKLAQYDTSAEEDRQLLDSKTVAGRARKALFVRYGEKLLLQEAIQLSSEKVDSLASPNGEESQPAAKRIRTK